MTTHPKKAIVLVFGFLAVATTLGLLILNQGPQKVDPTLVSPIEEQPPALELKAAVDDASTGSKTADKQTAEAPIPDATRSPVDNPRLARIKGRCVDTDGKPIPDCVAMLNIAPNRRQPLPGATTKRQARPKPITSPKTDTTGRFEIAFLPMTDARLFFRFSSPHHGEASGRLSKLEEGQLLDLGDVTLLIGSRVHGSVLDHNGQALVGRKVRLSLSAESQVALSQNNVRFRPKTSESAKTDAEGRFKFRQLLCEGKWTLEVDHEQITPDKLVVQADKPEIELMIRVRKPTEADRISGHIYDPKGRPISGAKVEYEPRPSHSRIEYGVMSSKDGSFELKRTKADAGSPLHLRIEKEGFDPLKGTDSIPWGTQDIRLTMTPGTAIFVHARDAETQKPVEAFGVRIKSRRMHRRPPRPQHKGSHADGILRLEGLMSGTHLICVVPVGGHVESEWKAIELPAQQGTTLRFDLQHNITALIQVSTAAGDPVVGSTVDLLEAESGLPIDDQTFIQDGRGASSGKNQARIWGQGKTDDTGRLTLHGPASRELGLRILGKGHVPSFTNRIRLKKDGDPIKIQVLTGATLVGRIYPMVVIREYDALRLEAPRGRRDSSQPPGLFLTMTSRRHRRHPRPHGSRVSIEADGSFRIMGIATGSWMLRIAYNPTRAFSFEDIGVLKLDDLREGEERRLDIDVSHLRLGQIAGKVIWNGKPAKNIALRMNPTRESAMQGRTLGKGFQARTDAEGRFQQKHLPGSYDCDVVLANSIRGRGGSVIRAGKVVTIAPGEKQQMVIEINTAELRVRFKDEEGKPLAGVTAYVMSTPGKRGVRLDPSDAAGECSRFVPAGLQRLMIYPKEWQSGENRKKRSAMTPEEAKEAYRKAKITLGTWTLATGTKSDILEITVPKSAGY